MGEAFRLRSFYLISIVVLVFLQLHLYQTFTLPSQFDYLANSDSIDVPTTQTAFSTIEKNKRDQDTFQQQQQAAWCPSAASTSSCGGFVRDHCNPCGRRWLIIVSMGRAASTTLTSQMWTLPGIHMGGENGGLVFQLNKAFQNTLNNKNFRRQDKDGPWAHEPVSKDLLSCSIQTAFEAINPPPNPEENPILGFKTIELKHIHDTTRIARFLQESFPCARFLINYRSVEAVKASREKWFKNHTNNYRDLQQDLVNLKQLGNLLPESQTRVLDSGQWTKNVTILNEVVDWMGYSKECHFAEVLQFNTKNGYGNDKTELRADPNCRYLG